MNSHLVTMYFDKPNDMAIWLV